MNTYFSNGLFLFVIVIFLSPDLFYYTQIPLQTNNSGETNNSIVSKMLKYLDFDTLLYFADSRDSLFDEQQRNFMPIIHSFNALYNLQLRASQSISESPKIPDSSRIRLEELLLSFNFESLIGLFHATEATKSLLAVLACKEGLLEVDEATRLVNIKSFFIEKLF